MGMYFYRNRCVISHLLSTAHCCSPVLKSITFMLSAQYSMQTNHEWLRVHNVKDDIDGQWSLCYWCHES